MSTLLSTEEKKQDQLVLIIDRKNRFGNFLAQSLATQASVVLVSEKKNANPSVISVPFTHDVPRIPDGSYSHIFFVWDLESTTPDLVNPVLEKAYDTHARVVFICDYRTYTHSLYESILKPGVFSCCVLTGDIYDEEDFGQPIISLFQAAKLTMQLPLPHMGLESLFLVDHTHTISAILHVGLGTSKSRLCFAFSHRPQTILSIAHALQQTEPLLKIDFIEEKEELHSPQLPEGDYIVHVQTTLKEIQQEFRHFLAKNHSEEAHVEKTKIPDFLMKENIQQTSIIKKKKTKKRWIFLPFILLILLLPFLIPLGASAVGIFFLYQVKSSVFEGKLPQGEYYAEISSGSFSLAQNTSGILTTILPIIGKSDTSQFISVNIENGKVISQTLTSLISAGDDFIQLAGGKALLPDVTFDSALSSLQAAILSYQQINTFSPFAKDRNTLDMFKNTANILSNIESILPQVLGMEKKQTYLILFQNNMELRPSGGFIGSYGVVSLDKGKVSKMTIHDVYDADGQLQGHIEPPFAIRRYMPLVHWYLRDSGFDVDFSKSAAQAAFFLKQETGEQVDGVIAVDLSFVQKLIQAVGSVPVVEYGQTVTPQNFFFLTESHAGKNTFAGSTQKKDFLQALLYNIQQKLFTHHVDYLSLMNTVQKSLQQKDLLITVSDPSVQDVFTVNGFSSSLWDPRVSQQNTLFDFTGINEANIGVNKVNYYILRQVVQQTLISPSGSVSGKLAITFTNTSTGEWPGGDYKNYLRFILPDNAVLRSVSIGGVSQRLTAAVTNPAIYESKTFVPPQGLEIERSEEEQKTLYGFLVLVPSGQKREVDISYDLPQTLPVNQGPFTYSMLLFKQPGVPSYPYQFSLSFPQNLQPLSVPSEMKRVNNTLTENLSFDHDTQLTIPFSQR